jgi:hypothetical protein
MSNLKRRASHLALIATLVVVAGCKSGSGGGGNSPSPSGSIGGMDPASWVDYLIAQTGSLVHSLPVLNWLS